MYLICTFKLLIKKKTLPITFSFNEKSSHEGYAQTSQRDFIPTESLNLTLKKCEMIILFNSFFSAFSLLPVRFIGVLNNSETTVNNLQVYCPLLVLYFWWVHFITKRVAVIYDSLYLALGHVDAQK